MATSACMFTGTGARPLIGPRRSVASSRPRMELINQTPVVGRLTVSDLEGTPFRYGMLTVKATFTVEDTGRATLDSQSPFAIFDEDEPTPLGHLPSDAVPRQDSVFEVIVLGNAYGGGRRQMFVELALGDHRRRLLVTGDRHWLKGQTISEAAPFDVLPLTWQRAHGGTAECWLDSRSLYDLEHPMNKYGRGFDAERLAVDVGKAFKAPSGYPRLSPDYRRRLPNVEDPRHPIQRWNDDPRPYCWATVPMDTGVHTQRAHDRMAKQEPLSEQEMLQMVYHRAHPDWIVPTPPESAKVVLRGMTKRGLWTFRVPPLRVLADYQLGAKTGTRELEPHLLMLLPEESRFYLVYRHFFTMKTAADMERSFRLRLTKGWVR